MTNFTPRVGKLFRCRNGTVVCITTLQRGKGDPGPEELDVYPIGVEVVVAAHTAWFASWPAAGQRLGYTAQGKFSASSSWPFEGFLELDIVGEAGAHEDLVTLPGLLGAEPEPKPAPTPKRVEFLALSEVPIDDLERAAGPRASGVGVGELTTFPRGLAHIEHNWPIPTVEHGNYGPFELGMELERRFEKQKADAYAIAHEARIQKNKVIIGQARRLGAMDRLEFRWLGASNNGGGVEPSRVPAPSAAVEYRLRPAQVVRWVAVAKATDSAEVRMGRFHDRREFADLDTGWAPATHVVKLVLDPETLAVISAVTEAR